MNQPSLDTSPLVSDTRNEPEGPIRISDSWSKSWDDAEETSAPLVAGYIMSIETTNFPTTRHGDQTIMVSPQGQQVTVLSVPNEKDASVLVAAIKAALGVPLWRLSSNDMRAHGGLSVDHNAIIRLIFWNEGSRAFEPYHYGRRITVERHLFCSGTANLLRMVDEAGQVVSSDEGSLDQMLRHFQICLEHPLVQVDKSCMTRVLQADPSVLYWMFLQAHQLEGLDERARKHLQPAPASWQKNRAAKSDQAGKLRDEANKLKLQLEESKGSIARLKLSFHLASHRRHSQDVATQQELLSQTLRKRGNAAARIASLKKLLPLKQQELDEVSSSLSSHNSRLKELEEKLRCAIEQRECLEEDVHQVRTDKSILAKETNRLELARRLAKSCARTRTGDLNHPSIQKASKLARKKPDSTTAAVLHLALTFSSTALASDHKKTFKQASQRRRRERALLKKIGTLESTIADWEADIDKCSDLAEGCRELIGRIKTAMQLGPAQEELQAIGSTCTDLEANVASLEAKTPQSWLAAREHALAEGIDIAAEGCKMVDEKLKKLLEQGWGNKDPSVYQTKLQQEEATRERSTTSHQAALCQLQRVSEEIEKADAEEQNVNEEQPLLNCRDLGDKAAAVDSWFQHFLVGMRGSGRLELDHDHERAYLCSAVPAKEMFWARAFLFALLGSSQLSFSVLTCDQSVAAMYRPFFVDSLIGSALQLDGHQSIIVTSLAIVEGWHGDRSVNFARIPKK